MMLTHGGTTVLTVVAKCAAASYCARSNSLRGDGALVDETSLCCPTCRFCDLYSESLARVQLLEETLGETGQYLGVKPWGFISHPFNALTQSLHSKSAITACILPLQYNPLPFVSTLFTQVSYRLRTLA